MPTHRLATPTEDTVPHEDVKASPRTPGTAQPFADRRGGPALYEGTAYQNGVALLETLGLLGRRQQSPLVVLTLRCEHRILVEGGQLGFDLAVVSPEGCRQLEMKSSPVRDEVVELLARLVTIASEPGQLLQLVHGKANRWTEALESLLRSAGEAVDADQLLAIVSASGDAERLALLIGLPPHPTLGPKALLARMARPEFLAPAAVGREVQMLAHLLAGERADDVVRRLTETLTQAFSVRATLSVGDLHADLVTAGLIYPVTVLAPPSDPMLTRAVGALDVCRSPLPEPLLARALGLPAGEVRELLQELLAARIVLDGPDGLWRPRTTHPVPRSMAGTVLTELLTLLIDEPPEQHLGRMAQVPKVLALSGACLADDPYLVARAFKLYEKAAKATGDLSSVYRLARAALQAAAAVPPGAAARNHEVLWLRAHARICGTSWTLQRVGQETEASAEMDAAREESSPFGDVDNLAFIDKCQGRLSRLRAEDLAATGDHGAARVIYDESRQQLQRAHKSFLALLGDVRFAQRYQEEPGECLALRARTELSQGRLDAAERYATAAHQELDGLGPRCKPWADTCVVDAEIMLARARDGMSGASAHVALTEQATRLDGVLTQFRAMADDSEAVDVGANEILARTLQVLGQLALETGDPSRASDLLDDAGAHFVRVDQRCAAYRCQAQALELRGSVLPAQLLAALEAAEASPGCRVETTRLHLADPRSPAPERHWASLVKQGQLAAAAFEHRWTDRAAG